MSEILVGGSERESEERERVRERDILGVRECVRAIPDLWKSTELY